MTIKFSCKCGKTFSAHADQMGKQVRCPSCGRTMVVGTAESKPPKPEPQPEAKPERVPAPPRPTAASSVSRAALPRPSAWMPVVIFLCVVALGVSISGVFVYLRTAKEIDALNRRVADLERRQRSLKASLQALLKSRPVAQPKAQAPAGANDAAIQALLKIGINAMGKQGAVNDLLDEIGGKKK